MTFISSLFEAKHVTSLGSLFCEKDLLHVHVPCKPHELGDEIGESGALEELSALQKHGDASSLEEVGHELWESLALHFDQSVEHSWCTCVPLKHRLIFQSPFILFFISFFLSFFLL